MKVKGLFFKKLGLVDLVGVGVFMVILATAVFFFLRRAANATIVLRVSQTDALGNYAAGLPMWYVENLKSGMEQKDVFGRSMISIISNYSYSDNSNNRVVYLTLKLLTTFDKKSGTYSYEGVPLLVGSYQTLKINDILLRGVVYRVENENWRPEKKTYLVEGFLNPAATENQDPYVANTISNGVLNYLADKFVTGIKIVDSDGSVVAEVMGVKKDTALRKFIYYNQLIVIPDNERKKVTLELKVTTEKYGDVYIFRDQKPLRINDNIDLSFWDFGAVMTVTDFKEI